MRRRTLVGVMAVAALLVVVLGDGSLPVRAQQPTPTATPTATPGQLPGRFHGTVLLYGKKPTGTLTVTAYIGATACGSGSVRSGVYAVNVKASQDAAGCGTAGATIWFKLGDYWANETGTWVQGQPQTLNLTAPKMRTDPLVSGCGNQLTVSFANKTPIKTLRTAIEPAEALLAIWKWNGQTGQWEGDFAGAPDSVNTLKTVNRLDVIWICTGGSAAILQPALDFQ